MNKKTPLALVILDGFGHSTQRNYNAIAHAHTPHLDSWLTHYPHVFLHASGEAVGLLDHVVGNSEVGHLTIGCGRIIPQPIKIISTAIDNGSFFSLPTLHEQFQRLKNNKGTLHLIGLLSDGTVHSHEKHLYAFIEAALQNGIHNIIIHPFLDGRDVSRQSARVYLERLEAKLNTYGCGTIGSIHGRFYAMDRDHNWDRTQKAYTALTSYQHTQNIDTHGHTNSPAKNTKPCIPDKQILSPRNHTEIPPTDEHTFSKKHTTEDGPIDWRTILEKNYAKNITDEFIEPITLDPSSTIKAGDGVIFYNFRPDRARQLTAAFIDPTFTAFARQEIPLTFFITPVSYSHSLNTTVLFPTPIINNSFKEILSNAGKTIFSIAETEKYAHITYFFSGYREAPFPTETRHLIHSIHKKDYSHNPKMSALKITRTVLQSLTHNPHDFYLINYANADMVGHSGNFAATVKAIECLDKQLKSIYDQVVKKMGGILCITADHGKAESMFDPITQQPITAHTTNDVPFIVIQHNSPPPSLTSLPALTTLPPLDLTTLSDIAPYLLRLMELPIPPEMRT